MIEFLQDFWLYFRQHKKYWILPIVILLLFFALILTFAGQSTVAPFIYTVF